MAFDETSEFLLLGWLSVVLLGGYFLTPGETAALARSARSAWYRKRAALVPGQPPGWLFAPVWAVLYLLLVGAYWTAFATTMAHGSDRAYRTALGCLTVTNVFLCRLWPYVFFRMRRADVALAMLLALALVCAGTIAVLARYAAWLPLGLFAPYALWIGYATYLNAAWLRVEEPSDGRAALGVSGGPWATRGLARRV